MRSSTQPPAIPRSRVGTLAVATALELYRCVLQLAPQWRASPSTTMFHYMNPSCFLYWGQQASRSTLLQLWLPLLLLPLLSRVPAVFFSQKPRPLRVSHSSTPRWTPTQSLTRRLNNLLSCTLPHEVWCARCPHTLPPTNSTNLHTMLLHQWPPFPCVL